MGTHDGELCLKARGRFPELVPQSDLWLDAKGRISAPPIAKTPACDRFEGLANVRATALSFQNMHHYGELLQNYLKVRHDIFIAKKGWQLPEENGMEFDQYDTPWARWVIIHAYGSILAGIRITPTTAQCGQHSYMLRDAQLGLLPGLPVNFLYEQAPVSDTIWEASRLFVCDDVSAEQRLPIQKLLMTTLSTTARSVGATHVIGIVPAVFRRWLNRIGMAATPVGPSMMIEGDRVQAALMSMVSLTH